MVLVTQMGRIVLQLSRVLLSQVTSRTLKTPLSKWLAFQYTNTIIMRTVFIGYTSGVQSLGPDFRILYETWLMLLWLLKISTDDANWAILGYVAMQVASFG